MRIVESGVTASLVTFGRALDVDVDDPHSGRASLVAIAKAAGVRTPLVSYENASSEGRGNALWLHASVVYSDVPGIVL